MGDLRVVNAETEIRQALSTKGKRYGALNAPYLIVIADCKDELVGAQRLRSDRRCIRHGGDSNQSFGKWGA
jgi:hypothetical protein